MDWEAVRRYPFLNQSGREERGEGVDHVGVDGGP